MAFSLYATFRGRRLISVGQRPGVNMTLTLPGAEPVATCQCGFRCHGDSLSDAVLAWTRHVTTSPCREGL